MVNFVDLFPGAVVYPVRAGGRGRGALRESRGYLVCGQGGYRLVRPKPGRWRKGFLRGEEVVQEDVVHLLRGLSPWEGREMRLCWAVGKPLGRPKALGGGSQQKGEPVFVLGGLDCLEVPRFGGAGNFPQVSCVRFSGRSSGLVILATEDSPVGGPPRFGVIGGSGHRCVFFEESH